jgi:TonB family protein
MIAILFALALGTGKPPPMTAVAKPMNVPSLDGLFSADDYPATAADRGEQGDVRVVIHVDDTGAVSSCEVRVSSGYPDLDTQTCTIIAQRAKFEPARDAQGRPVASEISKSISWRLEVGTFPSEPWTMRTILTFAKAGQPPACKMEVAGALATTSSSKPLTCDPTINRLVGPVELPDHPPMLIFERRFTRGGAEAPKLASGDTLIGRTVLTIEVDASGRVTACKLAEQVGEAPEAPCKQALAERYGTGNNGADHRSGPFEASLDSTIVMHPTERASEGGNLVPPK